MSDTPRTDAAESDMFREYGAVWTVQSDFCREFERENNRLREALEEIKNTAADGVDGCAFVCEEIALAALDKSGDSDKVTS